MEYAKRIYREVSFHYSQVPELTPDLIQMLLLFRDRFWSNTKWDRKVEDN